MKFNLGDAPPKVISTAFGVEVGNVYRNQRGHFYVVTSVFETSSGESRASAFALNADGEIYNVVCYICYYFARLKPVGKAINLPDIIDIEWFD